MLFHFGFNVALAIAFIFFTAPIARIAERLLPAKPISDDPAKPRYLDASALDTPTLAISCAAREALRIGDVIAQMLNGMLTVLKFNDRVLAERLRKMDDIVDDLYTAVKLYLTQISREALEESEGRRWTDIVSFTINMEQVGDIIERIITDIEDKKIDKGRSFSEAGLAEIVDLHGRLIANLQLGFAVFLNGDLKSAQELLAQKVLFRDLERAYANTHLERLAGQTMESIETSSLHLDLIADLRRINSHVCSIAYPILEQAGVLAKTRLKQPDPVPASGADDDRHARCARCPPRGPVSALRAAARALSRRRCPRPSSASASRSPSSPRASCTRAGMRCSNPRPAAIRCSTRPPSSWAPHCGDSSSFPSRACPTRRHGSSSAASAIIHWAYYITLAHAYRTGDLSFAYPLMRGTAPLLAAVLGIVFLREWPTPQAALGIALICLGIVSIAFVRREAHPRAALLFALANAAIIAVYTLIDGAGARASGNAGSYVAWLTFLEAIPFLVWIRARKGAAAVGYIARGWRRGIIGGAASLGAYGIVLWAMTRAPVAAVAALRETSVLFAALIGAIWLKEGFGLPRLAGAASVVAGVAALKL